MANPGNILGVVLLIVGVSFLPFQQASVSLSFEMGVAGDDGDEEDDDEEDDDNDDGEDDDEEEQEDDDEDDDEEEDDEDDDELSPKTIPLSLKPQ